MAPSAAPPAGAEAPKKKVTVSPFVKGFAGSMGGIAEAVCLQPIDVIKTRLQLDNKGYYKGVADCGTKITRDEGVRALWKGLTPFAGNLTLKYALRFTMNSVYQGMLRDKDGNLSSGGRLAAGFMAGTTEALLIVTPFEVVKIRLQQQHGSSKEALKYRGPVHCAATIIREEGPRGLWSGATPTVMRNATNQMCLFWAKNNLDSVLWGKQEGDGQRLDAWKSTVSGGVAAMLGPTMTNPFDVVKTRMMAQAKAPPDAPRYSGFFDAMIRIPQQEGMLAMYKGLLPRLMRIAPGQAIVWTVNDQIVQMFEKRQLAEAS